MDRYDEEASGSLGKNAITAPTDQLATVKTVLRGNTLTALKAAVIEAKVVMADD